MLNGGYCDTLLPGGGSRRWWLVALDLRSNATKLMMIGYKAFARQKEALEPSKRILFVPSTFPKSQECLGGWFPKLGEFSLTTRDTN